MKAGIDGTFLGEFTNDDDMIIFRVFAVKIVFSLFSVKVENMLAVNEDLRNPKISELNFYSSGE